MTCEKGGSDNMRVGMREGKHGDVRKFVQEFAECSGDAKKMRVVVQ